MSQLCPDALEAWKGRPEQLDAVVASVDLDRAAGGLARTAAGVNLGGHVQRLVDGYVVAKISGGDFASKAERTVWAARDAGVNAVWLALLQRGRLHPGEIPREALDRLAALSAEPLTAWPPALVRWADSSPAVPTPPQSTPAQSQPTPSGERWLQLG